MGGGCGRGAALTEELVRWPVIDLGIGGGLAGMGAGEASVALFAAAVTRRWTILDAGRT